MPGARTPAPPCKLYGPPIISHGPAAALTAVLLEDSIAAGADRLLRNGASPPECTGYAQG